MLLLLFIGFMVMTLIGMPIAFSLGVSCAATFIVFTDIPLIVIGQRIIVGFDSFAILAVPLFLLTGSLISKGTLAQRLVDLGNALVGHLKGGLANGTIIGSAFFGSICGSEMADVCAIGAIAIPGMEKEKYDRAFATVVVATAGPLAPIIPPSVIMVIYGWLTETSVPALFAGGFIPGAVIALFLMGITTYYSIRRNYPVSERASIRRVLKVFRRSASTLFAPVIILGGILTGIFTPTEAGAVAVVYVLFLEIVILRDLTLAKLLDCLIETTVLTGAVMLVYGMASSFAWLLISQQVPQAISSFVISISPNKYLFLAYINILFFIVGLFITPIPAMIIFLPLLLPAVNQLGVNLVHFGLIMTLNLSIGLLTPPVGPVLYAACRIGKVQLSEVIRTFLPYLAVLISVTYVITYVPWLTLAVPKWARLIR